MLLIRSQLLAAMVGFLILKIQSFQPLIKYAIIVVIIIVVVAAAAGDQVLVNRCHAGIVIS